jgi:hypothetical protein
MSNVALDYAGQYYKHSGRFSAAGVVKALLVGALVGVPLGVVYAYVVLYIPIAGSISFLITGGTGFLMGWVISTQIKSGKVRNLPMGLLIALAAAGLMYVTSWEAWLYGLVGRAGQNVSVLEFLTSPGAVWDLLVTINQNGAWSFKGSKPTGIMLDLLWLLEAGGLVGIPLGMTWQALNAVPFCEECNKWGATRDLIDVNAGDGAAVKAKLEGREFAALTALGKAPVGSMHFWHVCFQGCADCDSTQTLCVDDVALSVDKNGKMQTKRTKVVSRLLLTPEDTVAVATAVAALSVPDKVLEAGNEGAAGSSQNPATGIPKAQDGSAGMGA